ncbi:hypothetical protein B0H11DRAFT_1924302 [Mycena galericulata]|nr:hypothetical protein B0H11DRAFT_1924302 [Mycena galericulata]
MSSGETKAFVRTYVTERKIKSQGFRTQRIWIQGLSHRQGTAIPRRKGLRYKKPALYSGMPAADATKTRKYHVLHGQRYIGHTPRLHGNNGTYGHNGEGQLNNI